MRLIGALLIVAGCQQADRSERANCERVADILASFEIGNYAPAEQRVPVVAKHRDDCTAARVTQKEALCLANATDTWSAKACVPSMFPPSAQKTGDCKTATGRMRAAILAAEPAGSGQIAQIDKMMPVVELSCEQDKWPAPVTACMAAAKPGDSAAFQACAEQLPKEMQDRMATRMLARQQQQ